MYTIGPLWNTTCKFSVQRSVPVRVAREYPHRLFSHQDGFTHVGLESLCIARGSVNSRECHYVCWSGPLSDLPSCVHHYYNSEQVSQEL